MARTRTPQKTQTKKDKQQEVVGHKQKNRKRQREKTKTNCYNALAERKKCIGLTHVSCYRGAKQYFWCPEKQRGAGGGGGDSVDKQSMPITCEK